MKINITKLVLENNEIDYLYLDNVCKIKKLHPWYSRHRSKFSKHWLNYQIFNKKAEKFVGQNISKLYNSYKKENKNYHRNLLSLFRDHIDISNRKNEIIDRDGNTVTRRFNDYYVDKDNIIRKYKIKHYRKNEKKLTELEKIANLYWGKKNELKLKKELLITDNNLTYPALNRLLVNDILEIKGIEKDYYKLWNFLYKRDIQDKSDRSIKSAKPKFVSKVKILKTEKLKVKNKIIIKPKSLFTKSIFTYLTGLN